MLQNSNIYEKMASIQYIGKLWFCDFNTLRLCDLKYTQMKNIFQKRFKNNYYSYFVLLKLLK